MEKQFVFGAFLLLTMSCVHAENRLFPTDILNQGEVDVDISVNHQTYSDHYSFLGSNFGTFELNQTEENISARYGLGLNWQIGAELPYFSHEETISTFNTPYLLPPFVASPIASVINSRQEGRRNPVLRAAYGFLNDKNFPLSLKGELFVTPNTTGKAKSTYTSKLVAGWKSNEAVKCYGSYAMESSVASNVRDTYSIGLGAYVDIASRVSLIPHAQYKQFVGINNIRSQIQNGFGLSSDIQIQGNTYIIPDIDFYRNSSLVRNYNPQGPAKNGKSVTLALYHLF